MTRRYWKAPTLRYLRQLRNYRDIPFEVLNTPGKIELYYRARHDLWLFRFKKGMYSS